MKLKKIVDGKEYVLEQNFWTGKMTLLVDGEEIAKKDKKSFYIDGKSYKVKGGVLTGASLEDLSGEKILLHKNKWWESLLIFMPFAYFALGIFGGAVGGGLSALFACLAAYLNAEILRGNGKLWFKILLPIVLFVAFFVAWLSIYLMVVGGLAALMPQA